MTSARTTNSWAVTVVHRTPTPTLTPSPTLTPTSSPTPTSTQTPHADSGTPDAVSHRARRPAPSATDAAPASTPSSLPEVTGPQITRPRRRPPLPAAGRSWTSDGRSSLSRETTQGASWSSVRERKPPAVAEHDERRRRRHRGHLAGHELRPPGELAIPPVRRPVLGIHGLRGRPGADPPHDAEPPFRTLAAEWTFRSAIVGTPSGNVTLLDPRPRGTWSRRAGARSPPSSCAPTGVVPRRPGPRSAR